MAFSDSGFGHAEFLFPKMDLGPLTPGAGELIREFFKGRARSPVLYRVSLFGLVLVPTRASEEMDLFPLFVGHLSLLLKKFLTLCHRSGCCKGFECLFAGSTHWTFPVFRQVFKGCALGKFSLPVSFVRIIDVATIGGLALVHLFRFSHYSPPHKVRFSL